ncbi:hypothetical protein J27TS7_48610 [Paenibacillus dendritiformis]|uniref:hypothetical protein n=1 Tax=Paenibacillus dendritiformis TaxID=130049 RepID=UPI001B13BAC8|nr:hypothetical protein [Paenibacillus dendritiformis]GIO75347.1 hypothetical protein J27TS7_48610 [Paenibacillus dendritiformis]
MKKFIFRSSFIIDCGMRQWQGRFAPTAYPSKYAEKNGHIVVAPSGLKNAEKMEEFLAKHNDREKAALRMRCIRLKGMPFFMMCIQTERRFNIQ